MFNIELVGSGKGSGELFPVPMVDNALSEITRFFVSMLGDIPGIGGRVYNVAPPKDVKLPYLRFDFDEDEDEVETTWISGVLTISIYDLSRSKSGVYRIQDRIRKKLHFLTYDDLTHTKKLRCWMAGGNDVGTDNKRVQRRDVSFRIKYYRLEDARLE